MELNIVTPVSRAQNLPRIFDSIVEAFKAFPDWHAVWLLAFDAAEPNRDVNLEPQANVAVVKLATPSVVESVRVSASGNMQRNLALDKAGDGLVCFIDDDTVMHPNLLTHIAPQYADHPAANVIVDQADKNGTIRLTAHPDNVQVGRIDAGQVVLQRSLVGDCRWPPMDYEADGYFIMNNYQRDPASFIFLNVSISLYNYLR